MRIVPKTYKEYKEYVESGVNFESDNVITNIHGSIDITKRQVQTKHLYSALLFSFDKKSSDKIINMVREIKVDDDMMDSRCYPTNYWGEGNVLILGMAPGKKGRSIPGYDLKPSFIYTKTSFTLRKAIEKSFARIDHVYITNLLKHATRDNKVSAGQFSTCAHIFEEELNLMKPSLVITLGNDVKNYLISRQVKLGCDTISIMHPAAISYNGMSVVDYVKLFREKVNDYYKNNKKARM